MSLKLQWAVADKLVYSKIREGTGGNLRIVFSGGAPLSRDLAEFFWSIGISIYQGYGLTETSPVLTSNYPKNRVGSSGKPIPSVLISIAPDGEILAKGPCVMQGYYRSPDATREVLNEDGWFHTGDIGYLDPDNYLFITDRKKDLIKTAGGKFIAPQPIENALKTSPYILNAVVVGDQRKFVVALLVPNPITVEAKAAEQGITFTSNSANGRPPLRPQTHRRRSRPPHHAPRPVGNHQTLRPSPRRLHLRQRRPNLHHETQAPRRRTKIRPHHRIPLLRRLRPPPHHRLTAFGCRTLSF